MPCVGLQDTLAWFRATVEASMIATARVSYYIIRYLKYTTILKWIEYGA